MVCSIDGRTAWIQLQVQVTIETTGRMLPGTEIGAALAAIEPLRPDVIGLNCATGPQEMDESLRYLARHTRIPISVIPNAGLPEAAFAGALAVKLNGPNTYNGKLVNKPYIGVRFGRTKIEHIKKACDMMLLSSIIWLAVVWGTTAVVRSLF